MLITPKRMWYVTYVIGFLAIVVFSYTFFSRSSLSEINTSEETKPQEELHVMPSSFQQKISLKDALQSSFFSLANVERTLRLPDLRSYFTFLGCNERPDLSLEKMRVQMTLRGGASLTASAGEKVYLRFDSRANRWTVSEKPTCLNVVFKPRDNGVDVTVEIQDESEKITITPNEYHKFFLNSTASSSHGNISAKKWDVGGLPAEATLLEKQGARWFGKDVMIEALGDGEFAYEAERERVQFSLGENSYVLWVKEGDCFIFTEDRWQGAKLGANTKMQILLRAKKIDDKEMVFDLWNPDGALHAVCVLKRKEINKNSTLPEIKLLGARSKKHWIAEVCGKRVMLSPTEWIVFTEDGAIPIDSKKVLDDYLQGVLSGALLTFSGVNQVNGDSCLVGQYFDAARVSKEDVSIPLYRSCTFSESSSKPKDEKDDEEDVFFDDEDEDDENDED